ncbi:MAG: aldehyde dehydrogenase family protein, partial [Caldimonas sp.]
AETGGMNCMIADSTALPEQVARDVLSSAFDSAGQRCSALRVLCLQDDVAERAIEMLVGAMRELRLGATERLATDVGPVIDEDARAAIEAHIEAMRQAGHRVHRPLQLDAAALAHGCFVAPALIELGSIGELEREVFGPVLHVVRYRRDRLGEIVDAINATGYGLTAGVHTRIDETIETLVGRLRAGNVYVNRNIVGAVVGVQPFGGEGLSGTGPKAGGPLYLHRLVWPAPAWPAEAAGPQPAVLGLAEAGTAAVPSQALRMLHDWLAVRPGTDLLAERCDALAARSPHGRSALLPGPTGERNSYSLVPRATVLCIAETPAELLWQFATVLAAGGRAAWLAGETATRLRGELPAPLRDRVVIVDDPLRGDFDAALIGCADPALVETWSRRLAERAGPIVALHPIAFDAAAAPFALERLMVERTLSVNTAAAGGNASLMTIG